MEETSLKKMLEEIQLPKLSLTEVLETYKHIELTEDEMLEAVIEAKRKKEFRLNDARVREIEAKNRKSLTEVRWNANQTSDYMKNRANALYKGKFVLDMQNTRLFEMLCYYFSEDPMFVAMAHKLGIKNASLEKGILLAGNFGAGKTWMMTLFAKNQRQVYHIRNSKKIANTYESGGHYMSFSDLTVNPINDKDSFYHANAGLCIDDMGTEGIKTNYGNRKNVIGDLIEERYQKKTTGIFLHATTNLTAADLKEFYGERITSRMREIFNFIELTGEDRRE